MKHLLRVVNVISGLVIAVAVVVLLSVVFTPSGEVPSICGYSFLRTLTGSMEPEIPVHSLVVVQQVDARELAVGDVITFRSTNEALEGSLNTHRIVAVEGEGSELRFRTKGDANAVEDAEKVAPQNVVGRVVFVCAWIGVVASLLSNPLLFFPLIVAPLGILLIVEVVKLVRSTQEVARAEDEAALRAAVEAIRLRRAREADAAGEGSGAEAPAVDPNDPADEKGPAGEATGPGPEEDSLTSRGQ